MCVCVNRWMWLVDKTEKVLYESIYHSLLSNVWQQAAVLKDSLPPSSMWLRPVGCPAPPRGPPSLLPGLHARSHHGNCDSRRPVQVYKMCQCLTVINMERHTPFPVCLTRMNKVNLSCHDASCTEANYSVYSVSVKLLCKWPAVV